MESDLVLWRSTRVIPRSRFKSCDPSVVRLLRTEYSRSGAWCPGRSRSLNGVVVTGCVSCKHETKPDLVKAWARGVKERFYFFLRLQGRPRAVAPIIAAGPAPRAPGNLARVGLRSPGLWPGLKLDSAPSSEGGWRRARCCVDPSSSTNRGAIAPSDHPWFRSSAVEQGALNLRVVGSIPTEITNPPRFRPESAWRRQAEAGSG